MANPLSVATRGKGYSAIIKRMDTIIHRYGFTAARMERELDLFGQILKEFNCGASFALPAIVLNRHPSVIAKYLNQNIEFLVHGYVHVDYSKLSSNEQLAHLHRACEIFERNGIDIMGFRSPYLRRSLSLYESIRESCFSYVSNQPILWDILEGDASAFLTSAFYQKAIEFYEPWLAGNRASLPRLDDHIVEIPVSLPDDEMLIDRIGDATGELIKRVWQTILLDTNRRGELFTIQLHPERTSLCQEGLVTVLAQAKALSSVWIASLGEIAQWWRARAASEVHVEALDGDLLRLSVNGPPGTTILVRNVKVTEMTQPWDDSYQLVNTDICHIRVNCRPFIGVASNSPLALVGFLRQQGYIVEVSDSRNLYSIYFDQTEFTVNDEYTLLDQIEQSTTPLVRLGRWPNGARSALSITGDIDALTLWDYGLRVFGK